MARKPRPAPADLSELDTVIKKHEEGIVVPLLSVDGFSPLGFGIRVAGPESERYQSARDQMTRDIVYATAQADGQEITGEQKRKIETSFLARISMSFDGAAKLDGAVLTDSEEDFSKLYKRFPFIRRQIDLAQSNRANFTPSSTENSSTGSSEQSPGSESSQEQPTPESGQSSGE